MRSNEPEIPEGRIPLASPLVMLSRRSFLINPLAGLANSRISVLWTIDQRILWESPRGDSKRWFYTEVNTWWRGARRRRRRQQRRRQRPLGDATMRDEDFRARRASAHWIRRGRWSHSCLCPHAGRSPPRAYRGRPASSLHPRSRQRPLVRLLSPVFADNRSPANQIKSTMFELITIAICVICRQCDLCRFKSLIHTLLGFHSIPSVSKTSSCTVCFELLLWEILSYFILYEKLWRFYFSDLNARTTLQLLTIFYVMYCASLEREYDHQVLLASSVIQLFILYIMQIHK